jgi:thioredoxin reductase (NADPH)
MDISRCFESVVVGAGPIGLFASSMLGLLGIRAAVLDSQDAVGGQCTALYPEKETSGIPALEKIKAAALVESLHSQALAKNAVFFTGTCVNSITENAPTPGIFEIKTSNGDFWARAIVIAAGAGMFAHNHLGLPNESDFEGETLFYKILDVDKFAGSRVVIAGGGDAAIDWAMKLCEIAKSVHVVHRRDSFRCSPTSLERLKAFANEGIAHIYAPFEIAALTGKGGKIASIIVKNSNNEETIPTDYLLVFFGVSANVSYMKEWGLTMHNQKIVVNETDCSTNLAGVFAAGDVAHYADKVNMIVCGFGEAAKTAYAIKRFLGGQAVPHNWPTAGGK